MDTERDTDMAILNEYEVLVEDGQGGWNIITVSAVSPDLAVSYGLRSTHWARLASLVPHDFDYRTEGRREPARP